MRSEQPDSGVLVPERTAQVWRTLHADERGSVTAEFAITVPAVLLVLGLVIGSVQIAAERVSLTGLAGDIARLEARGDSALAAARLRSFTGNPKIERSTDGRILCVTASARPRVGVLAALSVTGRGCAAVSDSPFTEGRAGAGKTR